MDISMPGLNGLEAAVRMAREFPGVRVIILSMHPNEEYVWRALKAGAVLPAQRKRRMPRPACLHSRGASRVQSGPAQPPGTD